MNICVGVTGVNICERAGYLLSKVDLADDHDGDDDGKDGGPKQACGQVHRQWRDSAGNALRWRSQTGLRGHRQWRTEWTLHSDPNQQASCTWACGFIKRSGMLNALLGELQSGLLCMDMYVRKRQQ